MIIDLSRLTVPQLLALHGELGSELRKREILRSFNNPTSDLAEHLFCRAFGWRQTEKSAPLADARDQEGRFFQIKGRRVTPENPSRQLGALRKLPEGGFDFLGGVLFNGDYSVLRAALIPYALVAENSSYVRHTNSWRFMLRDAVWAWSGVEDVTAQLRAVPL